MAVTKRVRFEVLRRDNHTCRYCGSTAAESPLTVDHVVPVALGGSDDPSNLVAACKDCNAGKSSVAPDQPLVEQVSEDAVRWARALYQASVERLAVFEENAEVANEFRAIWDGWKTNSGKGAPMPLPPGWLTSIKNLIAAGLNLNDFEELVEVAMASKARDTFRYFCGCCWTRVRKAQERAAEIIAEQDRQDAVRDIEGRVNAVFAESETDEVGEKQESGLTPEERVAWLAFWDSTFGVGDAFDQAKHDRIFAVIDHCDVVDDGTGPPPDLSMFTKDQVAEARKFRAEVDRVLAAAGEGADHGA